MSVKEKVAIKEEYRPLFEKSFEVSIDEFWEDEPNYKGRLFDFDKFILFIMDNYPNWRDYESPSEWELAEYGPEVQNMMDRFGCI
jgi:hypothetical protein